MKRIALLALLLAAPAVADGPEERWYAVHINGKPSGHARETVTRDGDRVVFASEAEMTIRRGPSSMTVEMSSRYVETADGKPVEAEAVQMLAGQAVKTRLAFTEAGAEMTQEQAGQAVTRSLEMEPGWVTPLGARRLLAKEIAAGADTISFRLLVLEHGPLPAEVTYRRVEGDSVEVLGKTVPATAWAVTSSIMPGVISREYLDAEGRLLRNAVDLMGMTAEQISADETVALGVVDPPEVVASSLVKPDRPVPGARGLRRAVYEISGADFAPPSTGYQRVEAHDREKGTLRVVVDLDAEGEEPAPGEEMLAASAVLNHDDPAVRALAEKALAGVGEDAPAAERAEALRRFVHEFVEYKDLSVGFATATEVARTGKGDCTEHGVLLAALLRAAGIPARTATGVMYVDSFVGEEGVFGYHMWAQAYFDGRWHDLDAVLPDHGFDAAHITLATSALDTTVHNDIARMAAIGRIAIRVVEPE